MEIDSVAKIKMSYKKLKFASDEARSGGETKIETSYKQLKFAMDETRRRWE